MKNILMSCPSIRISFIPRRLNTVTDKVARAATRCELNQNWIDIQALNPHSIVTRFRSTLIW
ncbi:hypothetical protein LINPERPRIM_LOCUS33491 [Linum perenne]